MSTESLKYLDESADGVEFEPRDYEFEGESEDEMIIPASKKNARIAAKQRAETFKDHKFKKN